MLEQAQEYTKPERTIVRGLKRTERKGKQGMGPRGWLPEGFPSHLHQTLTVGVNTNALCGRKGMNGWGIGYADSLGKKSQGYSRNHRVSGNDVCVGERDKAIERRRRLGRVHIASHQTPEQGYDLE